jgi:hypothetical protein
MDADLEEAVVEAEHRVYREQVVQAAAQGQDMDQILALVDAAKTAVRSYNKIVKQAMPAGTAIIGSAGVMEKRLAQMELDFENKVRKT